MWGPIIHGLGPFARGKSKGQAEEGYGLSSIIRGIGSFIRWGPKAQAEEGDGPGRQYKYEIALGHSRGRLSPRHVRDLTRRKGKNGIETTWEKI